MTTTSRVLHFFKNGNVFTTLFADGTKLRFCEGEPQPLFPDSIDLKITNRCGVGCKFCHESSTPGGKHALYDNIWDALRLLPAGVEIAVGGGNPLLYPGLRFALEQFRDAGWISNITVRPRTLRDNKVIATLRYYKVIHGLGVSFDDCWGIDSRLIDENTILHVIAGLHNPLEVLHSKFDKILILGYKKHGRGLQFYNLEGDLNFKHWQYWLPRLLNSGKVVCFDNLALEQLDVKRFVPAHIWERQYMGNDGRFTMYFDAVEDVFAVSSTSQRIPREGRDIFEMFKVVRGLSKELTDTGEA